MCARLRRGDRLVRASARPLAPQSSGIDAERELAVSELGHYLRESGSHPVPAASQRILSRVCLPPYKILHEAFKTVPEPLRNRGRTGAANLPIVNGLTGAIMSARLPCGHRLLPFCHGLGLARNSSLYRVEESGVVVLDRKFMGKSLDFAVPHA